MALCMRISLRGKEISKLHRNLQDLVKILPCRHSCRQLCTATLSKHRLIYSTLWTRSRNGNLLNYGNSLRRQFMSEARKRKLEKSKDTGFRDLGKPFIFAMTVCGTSFAGCTVWQYESIRKAYQERSLAKSHNSQSSFYGKAGSFRQHLNLWWNNLSCGQKVAASIITINVAVFLGWKIRAAQPFMTKYFMSSIYGEAPCLSMLLSTFSHYNTLHLLANMYVLWSFSTPIGQYLGREQFVAFYLSAGVLASLASYVHKVSMGLTVGALGASGAIIGLIGVTCLQNPDSRLAIVGLSAIYPHSFSAGTAVKSLLAFDTIGLLMRWNIFDHAAHLGGMLFGLWYVKYGNKLIWHKRTGLLQGWHAIRGKPE